jgi:hypothetical protein
MTELQKIETPQSQITTVVDRIGEIAMNPDLPLDRLEKMMDMQERLMETQAKSDFAAAFARASAEFPDIPMNGVNKHQKTRYATLKDILSSVRPVLSRNGLAMSFTTETDGDFVVVTAELSHESGYSKTNSIHLPRDAGAGRNAVQAVGSSQTYGQRYTAQAILGLSLGEDTEDDGAGASRKAETISADQFVEITNLIEQSGIDAHVVCQAYKIPSLEAMPTSIFDKAKTHLQRKIEGGKAAQ